MRVFFILLVMLGGYGLLVPSIADAAPKRGRPSKSKRPSSKRPSKKLTAKPDAAVDKRVAKLDNLITLLDTRTSTAHSAFGKRNNNIINAIFGKKGAKSFFSKSTLSVLTGRDGLFGLLGKKGPLAKGQGLLSSLHRDYKKIGDNKRLRAVESLQSRWGSLRKTTKSLMSVRTLAFSPRTQKRLVSLRKGVKHMKKDVRTLKRKR